MQCGSYRLIALLNMDLKLFVKILANRLLPHILSLFHTDQASFMPFHEPRDNTIRVVNSLIYAARSSSRPLLLLSTDAEKGFDWVNWTFMRTTLEHIGLWLSMLNWILSLYSNSTASVKVNETRSTFFPHTQWHATGLPPIPSDIYTHPRALLTVRMVRADPDVAGFQKALEMHNVTTFVNDQIFFLTDPLTSFPPKIAPVFAGIWRSFLFPNKLSKSSILNMGI